MRMPCGRDIRACRTEKGQVIKMKIKRTVSILLLICMLASLPIFAVSCAQGGGADVHVFYYTYSDPYISKVRNSLDKALKDASISFQDHDGNGNQTTQTEQINTAITKGSTMLFFVSSSKWHQNLHTNCKHSL